MNIFDIIGPVMVGPSSSHTAGAVRIGNIARLLLNEKVSEAVIILYNSFLATGKGHGTDKALVAGLLGMEPEDESIPNSFTIAKEKRLKFQFMDGVSNQTHPNTAVLQLEGVSGKKLEIEASSLGGGRIKVCKIDGLEANFCGDNPTLIVHNLDQPGLVTEVTAMLAKEVINIGTLQLYRNKRGQNAVMVIECDQEIPKESIRKLEETKGILKVAYLSML